MAVFVAPMSFYSRASEMLSTAGCWVGVDRLRLRSSFGSELNLNLNLNLVYAARSPCV
jgi:hypothetical protein